MNRHIQKRILSLGGIVLAVLFCLLAPVAFGKTSSLRAQAAPPNDRERVAFGAKQPSRAELSALAAGLASELESEGIVPSCWGEDGERAIIGIFPEFYEKGKAYLDKNYGDSPYIRLLGACEAKLSSGSFPSVLRSAPNIGARIWNEARSASVGVFGRYEGELAFVTCGHDMPVGSIIKPSLISLSGFAQTVVSVFGEGSRGDFSIAKLASDQLPGSLDGVPVYSAKEGGHIGSLVRLHAASGRNVYGRVYATDLTTNVRLRDGSHITIGGVNYVEPLGELPEEGDSGGAWIGGGKFFGVHNGTVVFEQSESVFLSYTPYSIIKEAGFTLLPHSHTFEYSSVNAGVHRARCTVCDFTFQKSHSCGEGLALGECAYCSHPSDALR